MTLDIAQRNFLACVSSRFNPQYDKQKYIFREKSVI